MNLCLRYLLSAARVVFRVGNLLLALVFLWAFAEEPGVATAVPVLLLVLLLIATAPSAERMRRQLPRGPAVNALYTRMERLLRDQRPHTPLISRDGNTMLVVSGPSRISRVSVTVNSREAGRGCLIVESFRLLPIRPLVAWSIDGCHVYLAQDAHDHAHVLHLVDNLSSRLPLKRLAFTLQTGVGMATATELRELYAQLSEATPKDVLEH